MKKENLFAVLFIGFITALIFFKIFTRGLFPVPGDLLVSFYFPWYSGGWEGYNPWTTHKELLNADAIRQIIPWKSFAVSQFKKGEFPLWNPYTFSGQPLSANLQSSVYYPLNLFYFLTNDKNAWILLILIQPALAGIFTLLFLRSLKVTHIPAVFGATAFMFSSYLITWLENGNISHTYLWLPLAFFSIVKYFEKLKFRFLSILIISLTLSILAGHPQTAIYIFLASALFWLYQVKEHKKEKTQKLVIFGFAVGFSFLLSSIQLLPTIGFYRDSPVSLPFSREIFDRMILPVKNLVSFFASDFFGHPAANNFWGFSYGDFTPYFGVIPLVFSLWAIFTLWKKNYVKFASITALFFILSALNGPITFLIKLFRVPLLDSTTPSRFISISIFLLISLSALGLEDFLKNIKNKKYLNKFYKFLVPIGIIYLSLWSFAVFGLNFLEPKEAWQTNLAVTKRNLILPTLMFASLPIGLISINIFQKIFKVKSLFAKSIFVLGVFFVTIVGGLYYSNKFLPVSPKKFIFPQHIIFSWVKDNAGINRIYGEGTSHIDFNYPSYYQIYGAEGYDTLRLERYAQLLASARSGEIPKTYLRSDGVFPETENGYRKRLLDLLGIKYFLNKEDDAKLVFRPEKFQNDKVKGIWQEEKFQIYERETALPRIFMTTQYAVIEDDQEIIKKIYDPNYDLKTIILEEDPQIPIEKSKEIVIPKIVSYEPNEVIVKTNNPQNSLLFLSDAFTKDWNGYINNQKTKIYRANFALRAVAVPSGEHEVTFKYQPQAFKYGALSSIVSIVGFIGLNIYLFSRKKL